MSNLTLMRGDVRHAVSAAETAALDLADAGDGSFHLLRDGVSYRCRVVALDLPAKQLTVEVNGQSFSFTVADEVDAVIERLGLAAVDESGQNDVHAPMPGLVVDVLVSPGDEVEAGAKLLVLEAMKMENSLLAPADGTVAAVSVAKGAAVDKGQLLIEMA